MKHCKTRLFLILIGVVVNLLASLPIPAQPVEEDVRKEAEEAQRYSWNSSYESRGCYLGKAN